MSQYLQYDSATLCALVNSGKFRLPLSHTRTLELLALTSGGSGWNALAHSDRSASIKEHAPVLRAAINSRIADGRLSETAARECLATIANPLELGSAVGDTASKPTLGTPKSRPQSPRPVIILPPTEPFMVGRDVSRPRGFPANPTMENLRRYLKKFQPSRYALTAFELIMRDLESKATTISAPTGYNPGEPLNSRLADEIGRKKWRGDNPAGGYYPPWALLHALSLFVDVTIDADDGDYGRMVIATRTEPVKKMVYEIKGPGFDTGSGL